MQPNLIALIHNSIDNLQTRVGKSNLLLELSNYPLASVPRMQNVDRQSLLARSNFKIGRDFLQKVYGGGVIVESLEKLDGFQYISEKFSDIGLLEMSPLGGSADKYKPLDFLKQLMESVLPGSEMKVEHKAIEKTIWIVFSLKMDGIQHVMFRGAVRVREVFGAKQLLAFEFMRVLSSLAACFFMNAALRTELETSSSLPTANVPQVVPVQTKPKESVTAAVMPSLLKQTTAPPRMPVTQAVSPTPLHQPPSTFSFSTPHHSAPTTFPSSKPTTVSRPLLPATLPVQVSQSVRLDNITFADERLHDYSKSYADSDRQASSSPKHSLDLDYLPQSTSNAFPFRPRPHPPSTHSSQTTSSDKKHEMSDENIEYLRNLLINATFANVARAVDYISYIPSLIPQTTIKKPMNFSEFEGESCEFFHQLLKRCKERLPFTSQNFKVDSDIWWLIEPNGQKVILKVFTLDADEAEAIDSFMKKAVLALAFLILTNSVNTPPTSLSQTRVQPSRPQPVQFDIPDQQSLFKLDTESQAPLAPTRPAPSPSANPPIQLTYQQLTQTNSYQKFRKESGIEIQPENFSLRIELEVFLEAPKIYDRMKDLLNAQQLSPKSFLNEISQKLMAQLTIQDPEYKVVTNSTIHRIQMVKDEHILIAVQFGFPGRPLKNQLMNLVAKLLAGFIMEWLTQSDVIQQALETRSQMSVKQTSQQSTFNEDYSIKIWEHNYDLIQELVRLYRERQRLIHSEMPLGEIFQNLKKKNLAAEVQSTGGVAGGGELRHQVKLNIGTTTLIGLEVMKVANKDKAKKSAIDFMRRVITGEIEFDSVLSRR